MNKEQKITTELRRVMNITGDISDDEILKMTQGSAVRASVELHIALNSLSEVLAKEFPFLENLANKACELYTELGMDIEKQARK